jgi:hypothetical protein
MCHTREDWREGRGRAGGSSGVANSENLCVAAARWARGVGQVRMQASPVASLVISFKTALQVTAASSKSAEKCTKDENLTRRTGRPSLQLRLHGVHTRTHVRVTRVHTRTHVCVTRVLRSCCTRVCDTCTAVVLHIHWWLHKHARGGTNQCETCPKRQSRRRDPTSRK